MTTAPQYLTGEQVQVTLGGTVYYYDGPTDTLTVQLGADWYLSLPPEAAVTRLEPADGIPQRGDLWRDRHGIDWFTRDGGRMTSSAGSDLPWTVVNSDCGPLSLVYRPGSTVDLAERDPVPFKDFLPQDGPEAVAS